ncbi:MAG: CopG family transcriptional regulator [Oscillospiraceae bacterium]|nr:CopG family transcriptional regulator [Oscillospiraceae bacterium]
MGKSVYSIVLQDEVVQAVDAAAYRQGMSRSALINRLLAEAVSFVTPEEQMRGVFGALQRMLEPLPEFQLLDTASDAMCRLTSALRYKYNPVVRYAVALYRGGGGIQGELKASLRSQSAGLLQRMNEFFILWRAMEEETLKSWYPHGPACEIEPGRYTRSLAFPPEAQAVSEEELGECIALYIRTFDSAMKLYFSFDGDAGTARRATAEYYTSAAPKLFEKYIF